MGKNHRSQVQFTIWMDTRASEWEGVTKHHVKEAIDGMDEDELRRILKRGFDTVKHTHEK